MWPDVFAFSELGIFEILISQNMCRVSFCQLPEIQSKRFLDALPNYIPITESGAGEKKWSWGRRGDYEQPPGRWWQFLSGCCAAKCWWRPQLVTLYTLHCLHSYLLPSSRLLLDNYADEPSVKSNNFHHLYWFLTIYINFIVIMYILHIYVLICVVKWWMTTDKRQVDILIE